MKGIKIYFSVLIAVAVSTTAVSQSLFKANDENIRVIGRSLTSITGDIEFDWSGVSILANFEGSSVRLLIDGTGRNFFNVYIDGIKSDVIEVSGDQKILLAEGLEDAPHTLRITKRTEASEGKITFKGLELEAGKKLLAPSPAAERRIEYIGNSITCGYGTESNSKDDDFSPETENVELTYAAILAEQFEAEYHVIAHSGQGVVRNYGDSKTASVYSMPDRYKQVFDEARTPLWNFKEWTPDAVVINLGTNDFSTEPHPNKAVFNKKYNELIAFIREQYGEVPVFCVVNPTLDEPGYTYVKNMVDGNRNFLIDKNIYFIGIPGAIIVESEDLGANWHPNHSGQKKIAGYIAPVMKAVLGW